MTNPKADKLVDFLIESGIQDRFVINAIHSIPREQFVSQAMQHQV